MTSSKLLASLLSAIESSKICSETKIEEIQEFSSEQFLIKLRTALIKNLFLQIRIYKNKSHINYSYQVFDNLPLMRWDNADHFPAISTHPNHFHNQDGEVVESPLIGNPIDDIHKVLELLESLI